MGEEKFGNTSQEDYATMNSLVHTGKRESYRSDEILKIKKDNNIGSAKTIQTLARAKLNAQAKEKRQIVSYQTSTSSQATKIKYKKNAIGSDQLHGNNGSFTKSWQAGAYCNRES